MRRRHQPIHFKDLDWYKYVRRYFWDDETTPYLVPVERLHRRQADYEILAYVIFVSLLYGSVMLLTMSGRAVYADSFGVSLYALVVVCVSLLFAVTRHFPRRERMRARPGRGARVQPFLRRPPGSGKLGPGPPDRVLPGVAPLLDAADAHRQALPGDASAGAGLRR